MTKSNKVAVGATAALALALLGFGLSEAVAPSHPVRASSAVAYPNVLAGVSTANVWLSPTGSDTGANCTFSTAPVGAPAAAAACGSFDQALAVAQGGGANTTIGVMSGNFTGESTPTLPGSDFGIAYHGTNPATFACQAGAAADSVSFSSPTFLMYGPQNVTFTGSCFHFHVPLLGLGGYPANASCGQTAPDPSTGPVTLNGVHMDSFGDAGTCDVTIKNSQVGPVDACFGKGQAAAAGVPAFAECCPAGSTSNGCTAALDAVEAYWATLPNGTNAGGQIEPFVHNNGGDPAYGTTLSGDTFDGMQTKDPTAFHTGGIQWEAPVNFTIENSLFENNAIYNFIPGSSSQGVDDNIVISGNTFDTPYYTLADEVPPNPLPSSQCQDGYGSGGGAIDVGTISNNTFAACLQLQPVSSFMAVTVAGNAVLSGNMQCGTAGVTYSGNTGGGGAPLCANSTTTSTASTSTSTASTTTSTSTTPAPDVSAALAYLDASLSNYYNGSRKTGGLGYSVARTKQTNVYKAVVALGGSWP